MEIFDVAMFALTHFQKGQSCPCRKARDDLSCVADRKRLALSDLAAEVKVEVSEVDQIGTGDRSGVWSNFRGAAQ
jgi:hypothetical protein